MRVVQIDENTSIPVRYLGSLAFCIAVSIGAFYVVKTDASEAKQIASAVQADLAELNKKRDANIVINNANMSDLRTEVGNLKGGIGKVEGKVDAIILLMAQKR